MSLQKVEPFFLQNADSYLQKGNFLLLKNSELKCKNYIIFKCEIPLPGYVTIYFDSIWFVECVLRFVVYFTFARAEAQQGNRVNDDDDAEEDYGG